MGRGVGHRAVCVAAGWALGIGAAGCERPAAQVHEVPKGIESIIDPERAGAHAHAHEGHDHQGEAAARQGREVAWVAPQAWRRVDDERPMREATYVAPAPGGEVEVVVSSFSGDVGGLLANVNRWRGQLGLAPVDEAGLGEVVEPYAGAGLAGHFMRLRGEGREMLAAVIDEPRAERTWFVKAMVTAEQGDALEGEVAAFARSFVARGSGAIKGGEGDGDS